MTKLKKADELSPLDVRLLDELESGASYEDVASSQGRSAEDVRIHVMRLLNKIDKTELLAKYPVVYMQAEGVEGMDPAKDVMKVSNELGMSKPTIEAMKRRIAARQGMNVGTPKALTDRQLISAIEEKIALTLAYLDNFSLAGAPAKDLQAILDGLIKNAQLLKGRPTAITSVEDRRKINELLPLLVQEAKRRGVIIEGDVERIEEKKDG